MTDDEKKVLEKDDGQKDKTLLLSVIRNPSSEAKDLSPTRYGDWEINGKCVDF